MDAELNTAEEAFYPLKRRFRGFLPVVVDVETGGFNPRTDGLLQIAAVMVRMNAQQELYLHRTLSYQVQPFEGANLDPKSLEVNGIKPWHPFRFAVPEQEAIEDIFKAIRTEIKLNECNRAILVGHNAGFDLAFVKAAAERIGIKRNPFHMFSILDTVSLGALAYGQTVLAKSVQAAGIDWDNKEAHSATYDAQKTAELFCHIFNRWQQAMTPDVGADMAS